MVVKWKQLTGTKSPSRRGEKEGKRDRGWEGGTEEVEKREKAFIRAAHWLRRKRRIFECAPVGLLERLASEERERE